MREETVLTTIKILFIVVLITFFSLLIFTTQEEEYNTELSCKELRECILLKINCDINTTVKNKFIIFEWQFNAKASDSKIKDVYELNCLYENKELLAHLGDRNMPEREQDE